MARLQGRLERKQGVLGRIVAIRSQLFAISVTCGRAQMDRTDRVLTERWTTADHLADLFFTQARLRAEELFGQLWNNSDATDSKRAKRVLIFFFNWLEAGVIYPSFPTPPFAD